jgi:DNA-binding protein
VLLAPGRAEEGGGRQALISMAGEAAVAAVHPGRIQVSSTKPIYSYVNQAKRLLADHGEIQLSALGQAISTLVNVAEILKKDGLAVEKTLSTALDASTEDGRMKAKMEAVLAKSPKFDEIAEAQAKEHAAKQARPVAVEV